jgi:two-component sensor histidine kinase
MKGIYLFIVFLVVWFSNATAQQPYTIAINSNEGLSSDVVYDIKEDSRGFIWLATGSGLVRYDGETYTPIIADGRASKIGSFIAEDRLGRIWMESFDGSLFYVNQDKLVMLDDRKPIGFFNYYLDDTCIIHIYRNEVVVYDLITLKPKKVIERNNALTFHVYTMNGAMHVLGEKEWIVDANGATITNPLPIVMKTMTPILSAVGNDILYFVGKDNAKGNLYQYQQGKTKEVFEVREMSFIQNIFYLDDMFWFCCSDGLYIYNKQGKLMNGGPYFTNVSVSSVMKDRNGGYWVGTVTEGALVIRNFGHRLFETPQNRPQRLATFGDDLIVGTKNGRLLTLGKNGLGEAFYESKGNHGIFYLEQDSARQLLYCTSNSFEIFDVKRNRVLQDVASIKDAESLDDKYLVVAASGNVGLIWIPNSNTKSVWDDFYERKSKSVLSTHSAPILDGRGKSVAYDESEGMIYFCSNQGFYKQSVSGLEEIRRHNQSLNYIKIEIVGRQIFALTPTGKVECIDLKQPDKFRELKSLEGEEWKILKIIDNSVYVASDHDLARYDWKDGEEQLVYVFSVAGKDRISDFVKKGNRFFIAIDEGIIEIPQNNGVREMEPRFYLDRMFIRGEELKGAELSQLSYDQNEVLFQFSIASYPASHGLPVYYSLNGNEWNKITEGARSLKLDALRPGYYSVRFKIGENGDSYAAPSFIVRRPFWESYWFYIGTGFLVVAIGIIYYRYQTRLLKTQNKLQLEKLSLEKDLQSAMLQSIKSQMNPHFFYNALNTIQSFIFTDDKRNAGIFLSKFSQLTRMILEMSERESVSVSEEIQALNLYLEIESARFNYTLNYKLDVSPEVDTEMCRLPSMIVQPYVENAIKHGLLHKKENKNLEIRFKRDHQNLVIEIEDDGIGRVRSRELNRIKNKGHQSFATEANSRRLELLNRKHGNVGVEFVDKQNETGEGSGTLVIIRIPLI